QRRDMIRLMRDAGIAPQTAQVRPDEAELTRITGAQAPSGIPCVIAAPVVERAKRSATATRGRRSRFAQARRSAPGERPAPRTTTTAA
ncbi:ATP-dependent helicase, partial [Streptomyces sp. H39-C1]|nr:ATP-dependent helicase [Streptomyces sp. H39-C1]